jgi:RNA polymerase sigma factor (sigma-70 family)
VYQDVTSTFESFYTGTSSRLLRYAYGLTGDMAEAQDFTQEAYARAWQRWRRLQQYENPESWLRLVVSRLAVDRLRWLGVRRAKVQRGAQVVLPPNEEMLTLIAALKRLPMPQRKALVLHYFLDLPVAEIAAETGTNVNTVKTWLARGRVNVAAELTDVPPAKQDLQGIRDKARRRTNRTVASAVAAFLATATAAAAAFLAFPGPTPPMLRPDLVLPYSSQPKHAAVILIDQRAVTLWLGVDQKAHVGAIDLPTGKQPWPDIDLGKLTSWPVVMGTHKSLMVVSGTTDATDFNDVTIFGVDVASGKVRWQQSQRRDGTPLFDVQSDLATWKPAGTDTLVFATEKTVRGVNSVTGQEVWNAASTPGTGYSAPDGNRLAQFQAGGVLRILEVSTGRVVSERSAPPKVELRPTLWGDWLYLLGSNGVERMPITGAEPESRLVNGDITGVLPCGQHVCVMGRHFITGDFVAAFHEETGKQLWRKDLKLSDLFVHATDSGVIMTIAGARPRLESERGPDDRDLILDPDGIDITPSALGLRRAYWIDNEHLMLEREIVRAPSPMTADIRPRTVELSVYSLVTHEERLLGRQKILSGDCAGITGKYVCAGMDGIVVFH